MEGGWEEGSQDGAWRVEGLHGFVGESWAHGMALLAVQSAWRGSPAHDSAGVFLMQREGKTLKELHGLFGLRLAMG